MFRRHSAYLKEPDSILKGQPHELSNLVGKSWKKLDRLLGSFDIKIHLESSSYSFGDTLSSTRHQSFSVYRFWLLVILWGIPVFWKNKQDICQWVWRSLLGWVASMLECLVSRNNVSSTVYNFESSGSYNIAFLTGTKNRCILSISLK